MDAVGWMRLVLGLVALGLSVTSSAAQETTTQSNNSFMIH